ncbi:MAG: hypothetical protein LBE91_10620 [Tannerella sp.]|jgi:hypothetical protein|nr:hypothetical protein [Tannerella sp.]
MKKMFLLIGAITLFALSALSSSGGGTGGEDRIMLMPEDGGGINLPEVVITCNATFGYCGISEGRCWEDLLPGFLPGSICSFSGKMKDSCCVPMS